GYLAASHLIELGCKRIAFISGPMSCNLYIDRFDGFKKAMEQNSISLVKDYIFFHELTAVNARKDMHLLFGKKPYPDGILAVNDVTA
ncbi:substrate-binding domain-containing protein, partial [Rhizobium leguminosarum]|uniref:substrate-binding domain-containing protein n=1 Tax=Rhizobium leguminosarum TaxID=384 RepID=UPI003F951FC0